MSLLTEEQIEQLVGLASNQSTSKDLFDTFQEWNEKQIGIQFHVDWNNAPISATRAELQITWKNNSKFLISENIIGFIPRPPTSHPHAKIIAKYAEVAARRCDPWVEFEIWNEAENKWQKMNPHSFGLFDIQFKYRHIGDKP